MCFVKIINWSHRQKSNETESMKKKSDKYHDFVHAVTCEHCPCNCWIATKKIVKLITFFNWEILHAFCTASAATAAMTWCVVSNMRQRISTILDCVHFNVKTSKNSVRKEFGIKNVVVREEMKMSWGNTTAYNRSYLLLSLSCAWFAILWKCER